MWFVSIVVLLIFINIYFVNVMMDFFFAFHCFVLRLILFSHCYTLIKTLKRKRCIFGIKKFALNNFSLTWRRDFVRLLETVLSEYIVKNPQHIQKKAFQVKSLGASCNQDVSRNLPEPEPKFQEHSKIGLWLQRHTS